MVLIDILDVYLCISLFNYCVISNVHFYGHRKNAGTYLYFGLINSQRVIKLFDVIILNLLLILFMLV